MSDLVLQSPPEWSLWIGSFGRLFVWIGIGLYFLSLIGWIMAPKNEVFKKIGAWGFTAGTVSLFATFGCLAILFANNRFEFEYVWSHADKFNTLPYRIAGIWSGQQGSFMLWGVCSAIFALLALRGTGNFRRWFTIPYAAFLGGICAILAYESPYGLNMIDGRTVVPPDGVGLAPSLQNYWVTIHPPTIFLGFGSLTVLFAYAIAAMATREFTAWAPKVRPWSIVAATLVGLGLCMGGFWAYETLGWGGFWMWDPVENTSFVPWCLTVALIHGLIVQITRNKWHISNLLFGALPFLAFMYGTFLTRSGFLSETSVHSFAQMDSTALWVLIGMGAAAIFGFLGLWVRSIIVLQAAKTPTEAPEGLHREGFYRAGNFFLVFFAIATGFGMSVPMIQGLMGEKSAVVQEGLYHQVLAWPFFPLLLLMAAAPFASWRGTGFKSITGKLYGSFCITIGLLGTIMLLISKTDIRNRIELNTKIPMPFNLQVEILPWMMILIGTCIFVIVANTWRIIEMFKRGKTSIPAFLSHLGVATILAGLIISRGFEKRQEVIVQEGRPSSGIGYTIALSGSTVMQPSIESLSTANHKALDKDLKAGMTVHDGAIKYKVPEAELELYAKGDLMNRNNKVVFNLKGPDGEFEVRPGLYYMRGNDGENRPMVWPHIERTPFHDVYFTLHPMELNASDVTTLQPGQVGKFDRFEIKYVEMTREGENGQVGTKFGAKLALTSGPHSIDLHPQMEMTAAGTNQIPALIGDEYFITMQGMDAATGAVHLQLHFIRPLYPIEIFYKPMTILVWGGTGILTLAGFWAAWVRRRAAVVLPEEVIEATSPKRKPKPADDGYAPSPTP